MWRSLNVRHYEVALADLRFAGRLLRSGISHKNELYSFLNLHCLTVPQPYDRSKRFYALPVGTEYNGRSCQAPRDLAPSDAQRRTIYALSTPSGKAGVGVIRISGPDAIEVWKKMVRRTARRDVEAHQFPEPWKMDRCRIVHPEHGEILDDGLVVFFKGPKSFTTEDVLELHVHSGRAIVASVLAALSCLKFCKPAEPGEFTRRAFEGGRLDLTQVEGLKDLIDAETEGQRRIALKSAEGTNRALFESLRLEIIKALAMVEALIDFGEGEEIEEGVYDQAREHVIALRDKIQGYLSDHRRGELIRSGIRLAIFGPPNAGKSSLLNFLAQREAAIVTPVPGTTRDILELSLDIGGLPIIVSDTAGLRKTNDPVERIGIERAKNAIQAADVSLCVLSLEEVVSNSDDGPQIVVPPDLHPLISPETLFLLNKADLVPVDILKVVSNVPNFWACSLNTGQGTTEFLDSFSKALQKQYDLFQDNDHTPAPLITHTRHRVHLESAVRFLEAFLDTPPEDIVLGAEELRYAAKSVGKVSGLIDVEDVLDAVFRDFCIGK